jgi:single-stranded-DNA-specific exonuclease
MLTKEKIKKILSNRIEEISSLSIPHFLLLDDIQKASKRIKKAIENNEKIVIVGDYDVDGVCSSAIMKEFFDVLGYEIEVVIPNRFIHGYGLSLKLLDIIKADLIITVDNGITSIEAVEECKKRGIDVIITDHHTPFEVLPNAYAIVNPKTSSDFPFKEICGAEVAWYLCAAIKHEMKVDFDLRYFSDVLAIAIIADVMPLNHMNRVLVVMGLKRLNKAIKPFSKAIKKFFNKDLTSEDIAYQVAPRLNAAGRMKSANLAYKFLISKDEDEAYRLFLELDELNNLRKEEENKILNEVEIDDGDDFLIISGDFHEGVVGIIASRLVSRYKKPAIVFCEEDGVLKGSGRSLGNIDIFELVKKCEEYLEGFGGHKLACGLKIKKENLKNLKEDLNLHIKKYNKDDFFIEDFVLGELPFSEIDFELLDILKSFEPYGEGNPKPKFIASADVLNVQNLKDNHYKLILKQNDTILPAILFRYDGDISEKITFKFSISENNYYGREIQLIIEEIL